MVTSDCLVRELKDNDQDFEWYPTTQEIINRVKQDLGSEFSGSVLDIGAGNGSVLDEVTTGNKYAIEKSKILIENMDKDIFVIGTDFHNQTLIDKEVDVIFCNPPYSEYKVWMEKIIQEANAGIVYLVVPSRWKNLDYMKDSIKQRRGKYKTLGHFDFLNAEREARAQVDLLKISLTDEMEYSYHSNDRPQTDPFAIWFAKNFKINRDKKEEGSKSDKFKGLVKKENYIPQLETFYQKDLADLIELYKALENIDSKVLTEIGISLSGASQALKLKISGLKNLYWEELFDNLDAITKRLTSRSRQDLLSTLTWNTSVDFTADNAYSVIIWAIKNANEYMDRQLKEVYMDISDSQNVSLYKSNHRILDDEWRYNKRDMTHYKLDYRIVHDFYHTFSGYDFEHDNGLHKKAHDFIGDLMTIAENLGFSISTDSRDIQWSPGTKQIFYCQDDTVFCEVRAYKNGNIHFKFKPEFMKKMNIEAARLNGWIKSPKEAQEELDVTEEEAEAYFNVSYQITGKNVLMLKEAE